MKIAFATQDKVHVDAHFGWAKSIAVYDVTTEEHTLLQIFDFGDKLVQDGDDEKLAPKLEVIRDCAILYVAAIGGTAAARVVALNVHPVKVPQPLLIEEILIKLSRVLKGSPAPWLRKKLTRERGRSYDFAGDDELPSGQSRSSSMAVHVASDACSASSDKEGMMSNDSRELKTRLKKLNSLATQAKMDLHDLSEELPTGWEQIMVVAQRCHDAHAALMQARQTAVSASD